VDLDTDLNLYEDIDCPLGTDLVWGFQIDPLDLTGTTSVFFLNGVGYDMTLSIPSPNVSQLQVKVSNTVISALGAGLWSYYIRTTYTDGSIGATGYGEVIVS
jgi:hypothetical protein